jgi:hypothetical protein
MKNQSAITLLLACFVFIIFSCSKNNSSIPGDSDTQSAADNSFAESTSNDAISISTQSEDNGVTGNYTDSTYGFMLSPCATVTIDLVTSPHVLTIDFGSADCLCFDGKYRRGKILISYTGLYRDSASLHTISFNNYYVNNYKVEGTTTVVNNGHNAAGNLTFSVQVDATITDSSGHVLTYSSARTREWVAGESTAGLLGWVDDVYSITGTASGTDFSGTTFTSNITSALIVALNCRWIEAGKIDFTPAGKLTRHLDFGNGDCDNKMNIKIGGLSFDILLP